MPVASNQVVTRSCSSDWLMAASLPFQYDGIPLKEKRNIKREYPLHHA